jgi:galactose oxidase
MKPASELKLTDGSRPAFLTGVSLTRAFFIPLLLFVAGAAPAGAQVTEVVVGVTPTCPYGISACWAGAREGLGRLEGIETVASTPDAYNCTARVQLKDNTLPAIARWYQEFQSAVGQTYALRGVEVTVEALVEGSGNKLVLRLPKFNRPVMLAPLRHKLQWNFKKNSPRQPEPDERDAYQLLQKDLKATEKARKGRALQVQVTGPLEQSGKDFTIEVREYFSHAPSRLNR